MKVNRKSARQARRENLGGMFADIGSWLQGTGLNCPRPHEGVEGETEGGASVEGEGPERVRCSPS